MPATAVPLAVAYFTLAGPAVPDVRVTVMVRLRMPSVTFVAAAVNFRTPASFIVTVLVLGEPSVAAVGLLSRTVKLRLPCAPARFRIAMTTVLLSAFPSAQFRVPDVAV